MTIELTYEQMKEADIDILAPIMKRAFDEDTRMHLSRECGGPKGYDDGSLLRTLMKVRNSSAFKIMQYKTAIGAFIIRFGEESVNCLELLFLDTNVENRGIGKMVWDYIEQAYPQTHVWMGETPIYSHRNHNFYVNKCGFHIVKIKNPSDPENGSYILEKRMTPQSP